MTFSPITLNQDWSRPGRLIFIALLSTWGCLINGFFISSFFVEKSLRKNGHIFLGLLGLLDFFITFLIFTPPIFVLLSEEGDNVQTCHAMQFLGTFATYSYALLFMFVGIENYCRSQRSELFVKALATKHILWIVIMLLTVSFIYAFWGTYVELDYDYCERKHHGNEVFRKAGSLFIIILPGVTTVSMLLAALKKIRTRAKGRMVYRRSHMYLTEKNGVIINMITYLLFVACWFPYFYAVNVYPDDENGSILYTTVVFGLSRAAISSLIYGTCSPTFRRAFYFSFNYFCCRNCLTNNYFNERFAARNNGRLARPPATQVHMIQQPLSTLLSTNSSPHHFQCRSLQRETTL